MAKLRSGLKYFMTRIIDYAGMYPPANLSFYQAFKLFLEYQHMADSWMMDRFVFPIREAENLLHFRDVLRSHGKSIKFTVLPVYNDSPKTFLDDFKTDFAKLKAITSSIQARFELDFFEFKLPFSLKNALQNEVYPFFDSFLAIIDSPAGKKPQVFVEMHKLDGDWQYGMDRFTNMLTYYPVRNSIGFKLRCGGITSDSFPEVSMIAAAIHLCRQKELPMKFTAGLHHPLSHFNSSLNTRMYGFFNVLGAAVLSHTHLLSIKELETLIVEERVDQFSFADQGMKWRDYVVNTEQIKQAREQFCLGYGSCSFDEPRQDLRSLQLL